MVDFGTPDRAAARSAVYAPTGSIDASVAWCRSTGARRSVGRSPADGRVLRSSARARSLAIHRPSPTVMREAQPVESMPRPGVRARSRSAGGNMREGDRSAGMASTNMSASEGVAVALGATVFLCLICVEYYVAFTRKRVVHSLRDSVANLACGAIHQIVNIHYSSFL